MLKVRRTLTQILLEVTTEEMTSVAREVYQKARAKGTSFYKILELVFEPILPIGLYLLCRQTAESISFDLHEKNGNALLGRF